MPKVTLNPLFESIRGELEGYVFRRTASGKIFMSKKPDMSKVQPSPAQTAHHEKFKQAVAYAHLAKSDPEMWPYYEQVAKDKHSQPFRMAISGFFRVHDLQLEENSSPQTTGPLSKSE
jgi:hypothetical protein